MERPNAWKTYNKTELKKVEGRHLHSRQGAGASTPGQLDTSTPGAGQGPGHEKTHQNRPNSAYFSA